MTSRRLLTDRAGPAHLPFDEPDPMLLFDVDTMLTALCPAPLENARRQGYHAVTSGYILGAVAERADATVQRVAPTDPRSRDTRKLIQIPRIVGKPRVPVLTLHGLGDLFVPFSMEEHYAKKVAAHGRSRLLVQRAVRSAGHREFTPTEVGRAWSDLQTWVQSRTHGGRDDDRDHDRRPPGPRDAARPAGDVTTDPSVIASPTYGCRFTDPSGFADPAHFPTRPLFARCPAG